VNVAHDRDDRGPRAEVFVVLARRFGVEIDVEGLEQLTVLVLGRDDLDLVPELLSEDFEGRLVERLRDRGHLTEVEEHGDQVRRIRVDLLGEIGQRRAATQTQRRIAVSAGNGDATDRRSLHLLELCALRPLRLPALLTRTSAAAECALRASATATGSATAGTAGTATRAAARTAAGAAGTAGSVAASAAAAATGSGLVQRRVLQHRGIGTRCARTRARTRTCGALLTGTARLLTRLRHALRGCERVVAGASALAALTAGASARLGSASTGLRHSLRRGEGVVARACGRPAAGLGGTGLRSGGLGCCRLRGSGLGGTGLRSTRLRRRGTVGLALGRRGLGGLGRLGCGLGARLRCGL